MNMPGQRRLTTSAQEAIDNFGDLERSMLVLKDRWIPYRSGVEIEDELKFLLARPKCNRPSGMAIIGSSNNGKTEIIRRFVDANQTARFTDRVNARILEIEAPPVPSLGQLYSKILSRIGDPKAESGTSGIRLERLLILLARLEVEFLIIDEIHNVLAGSPAQQKAFLNMLKHISNELKAPVVIAGTESVEHVIGTDYQVQSRYPIFHLPLWKADDELAKFLVRLEATLPLKNESHIWQFTTEIHGLVGGVIGNVVGIVKRAAHEAIIFGEERITLDLLKKHAAKLSKRTDAASY